MQKIVKVFASGTDQDRLGKKYPIVQRYTEFILLQVEEEEIDRLSKKYLLEDMTDQYILEVGGVEIDTTAPPESGMAMGGSFGFAAAPITGIPGTSDEGSITPGPHHYLVVFDGPIKPEWLEAVKAAGGELRAPYQNFTYIVNADEATLPRLQELTFIRWIGRLPTESRIDSALRGRAGQGETIGSLTRTQALPSTYLVEFFTPQDATNAKEPFQEFGAQIIGADEQAGVLIIELSESETDRLAKLEALATVHGVRAIRERTIKRISNELAPRYLGAVEALNPKTLALSGQGEIICIADTGLDSGDPNAIHPDFSGRVIGMRSFPITADYSQHIDNPGNDDGASDLDSGHGTHVAGSALGSGQASSEINGIKNPIRGIAYNAQLVFQALEQEMHWKNPAFFNKYGRFILAGIPLNIQELFDDAYQRGARVHSNSWGGGDPGAYDTQCEQLDRFVWEHKDFCILVAAGNDGADHNQDGQVDPMSVSSPGTAKNCITIGACESYRPNFKQATYGGWWPDEFPAPPLRDDLMADDPNQVAAFSSRGPTFDGRIKPDLLAPGTFILSTRSRLLAADNIAWNSFPASTLYFFNGGTSMATPLAAGATALVREYLRKYAGLPNPSAALVKAVLIAGAKRIKSSLPKSALYDNDQGFGRINLDAVLSPVAPARVKFFDVAPGLATGESATFAVRVISNQINLRVTLVYTDYPGRSLVNNLNLIARGPTGRIYAGNAPRGKLILDNKNNLEVLQISRPRPGIWQIQIVAANVPNGPQDFALVALGDIEV